MLFRALDISPKLNHKTYRTNVIIFVLGYFDQRTFRGFICHYDFRTFRFFIISTFGHSLEVISTFVHFVLMSF